MNKWGRYFSNLRRSLHPETFFLPAMIKCSQFINRSKFMAVVLVCVNLIYGCPSKMPRARTFITKLFGKNGGEFLNFSLSHSYNFVYSLRSFSLFGECPKFQLKIKPETGFATFLINFPVTRRQTLGWHNRWELLGCCCPETGSFSERHPVNRCLKRAKVLPKTTLNSDVEQPLQQQK